MRLRKRFLVMTTAGLVAVGALVGGVALASPLGDSDKPRDKVIERAAAELGVEPDRLSDAFEKAHASLAAEATKTKLQALVEAGRLTQQEADEILVWIEARPAAVDKLGPTFGVHPFITPFKVKPFHRHGGFHHFRFEVAPGVEVETETFSIEPALPAFPFGDL